MSEEMDPPGRLGIMLSIMFHEHLEKKHTCDTYVHII